MAINIYTDAQNRAYEYLLQIDRKLQELGTYGVREKTQEDIRAENLLKMTGKYGEQAVQDLVQRHGGL